MGKKLCFINGSTAYFTDNFEKQAGDDWSSRYYEGNAGLPYEIETEVDKVFFESYLDTPNERNEEFYSVEEINNGETPWLSGGELEVYAGITKKDFVNKILSVGGKIYLE